MKRKFLTALMAATMVSTMLAGCGNTSTNEGKATKGISKAEQDKTEEYEEKTIIKVWTIARANADYVNSKVDEYNKTNEDGIFVEYEIFSDNYIQALDMAAQSGNMPDISAVSDKATYGKYKAQGQWLNLNDYMDDQMKETFSRGIIDGVNKEGDNVYYVIAEGTVCRLFYNKEIFDRVGLDGPPTSLEQMVEYAKKITEELSGEGIYGFAQNMKSPYSALSRSLDLQMNRELGLNMGFNFATGQYEFEKLAQAAEYWKELLSEGVAFPGCESLDIDPLRSQFAAGKIGMYFSYTHAEPSVYANQFPMDSEKWDCAPIPTVNGQVVGLQNFGESAGWVVDAKSPNAEKAFKVLKDLFIDEEFLVGHYEGNYGISIIPSVIEKAKPSEAYQTKKYLLITDGETLLPTAPQVVNSQAVAIEGDDYYTTFSTIIYGGQDANIALKEASNRYNTAYQKGIQEGVGVDMKIEGFDPMNP